jgi:NAD+ synthase
MIAEPAFAVVRERNAVDALAIDAALVERWLVRFLRDELTHRRGITQAGVGISGGVDSAVVAYLCARALGPKNVHGIQMP